MQCSSGLASSVSLPPAALYAPHRGGSDDHAFDQSRNEAGTAFNIEAVATFARIRSLLIMIGDESTSRRCRPMLNSLSLRYPVSPLACSELMTVEMASSDALTLSRFSAV